MLGRTYGRWDWWRIKSEHTPQEWALQRAIFQVDPWGDQRDDLREAVIARRIVSTSGIPSDCNGGDFDALRFYLKSNQPKKEFISPKDLKRRIEEKRKETNGIG